MEKEQIAINRDEVNEAIDTNGSKVKIKKAREGDTDLSGLRISLPVELSSQVRHAIAELKTRGKAVSAEEILGDFFIGLSAQYLIDKITSLTPEEYYLEEALKIPELREKLIQQAKKSLAASVGGVPSVDPKPKGIKKSKAPPRELNNAFVEQVT